MDLHQLFQEKAENCLADFEEPSASLEQLQDALNLLTCSQLEASFVYPSKEEGKQKESCLVYLNAMVQDIRDPQYYYSYLI